MSYFPLSIPTSSPILVKRTIVVEQEPYIVTVVIQMYI